MPAEEALLADVNDPSCAAIPVVIVSGAPSLPEQPGGAKVRAVLVKPFDIGVLLALVERLTRSTGTAPGTWRSVSRAWSVPMPSGGSSTGSSVHWPTR